MRNVTANIDLFDVTTHGEPTDFRSTKISCMLTIAIDSSSIRIEVSSRDDCPGDIDRLLPACEKLLAEIAGSRDARKAQLMEALTR